MYKVIIVFLAAAVIAEFPKDSHRNLFKLREHLSSVISSDIRSKINNLFTFFKLYNNTPETTKLSVLLEIDGHLRNITESNNEINKAMKNNSKIRSLLPSDNKNMSKYLNISDLACSSCHLLLSNVSGRRHGHSIWNATGYNYWNWNPANVIIDNKGRRSNFRQFFRKVDPRTPGFRNKNRNANNVTSHFDYLSIGLRRMEYKRRAQGITNSRPIGIWDRASESSEELNASEARRLYHGQKTRIEKYPFMASIHIDVDFMCAGSIISMYFVLTAASCLKIAYDDIDSPRKIFLRVSSGVAQRSGDLLEVRNVYFHPDYDPVYLSHNVALADVDAPFMLRDTNRNVKRIEYERDPRMLAFTVTVLGWGDQKKNVIYRGPLSKARLEVYAYDYCKEVYSRRYVREGNFCAGSDSRSGGACYISIGMVNTYHQVSLTQRDVGGPAIVGHTLVGVISFGPPACGTSDAPTVFTHIGYYAEWIDSIIFPTRQKTVSPETMMEEDYNHYPPTQPLEPDRGQDFGGNREPESHKEVDRDYLRYPFSKRIPVITSTSASKPYRYPYRNPLRINPVNKKNKNQQPDYPIFQSTDQSSPPPTTPAKVNNVPELENELQVLRNLFRKLVLQGGIDIEDLIQSNGSTTTTDNPTQQFEVAASKEPLRLAEIVNTTLTSGIETPTVAGPFNTTEICDEVSYPLPNTHLSPFMNEAEMNELYTYPNTQLSSFPDEIEEETKRFTDRSTKLWIPMNYAELMPYRMNKIHHKYVTPLDYSGEDIVTTNSPPTTTIDTLPIQSTTNRQYRFKEVLKRQDFRSGESEHDIRETFDSTSYNLKRYRVHSIGNNRIRHKL